MPCSTSSMSLAILHFSGSPTTTGTMWVLLNITGSPDAASTALTRAARSCWRSRSHCEVLRCRIAAVAAAQIAGGKGGRGDVAAEPAKRLGEFTLDHVDPMHRAIARRNAGACRPIHADRMY